MSVVHEQVGSYADFLPGVEFRARSPQTPKTSAGGIELDARHSASRGRPAARAVHDVPVGPTRSCPDRPGPVTLSRTQRGDCFRQAMARRRAPLGSARPGRMSAVVAPTRVAERGL